MGIAIIVCFIGATWCAIVASNKNIGVLGYTLLGFLLPLIGIIAVHAAQPAEPTK